MSIVDYIQSQSNAGPLKSPTSTLVNSVPLTPTDTSSVQTVISPTQLQKQEGIVIQTTNAESFLANFSATAQINHQHISNPLPVVSASSIEPNSVVETTGKNRLYRICMRLTIVIPRELVILRNGMNNFLCFTSFRRQRKQRYRKRGSIFASRRSSRC